MRSRAIYFPFISIAKTEWAYKTLLYWDRISSIVPLQYIERPDTLEPFMRELVRTELVDQIMPSEHVWKIQNFEEPFIKYIEGKIGSKHSPYRLMRSKFPNNYYLQTSRIHIEKMRELPHFLEAQGFARRVDHSWYEVPNWIAEPFMAYLTTTLGMIKEIDAVPITDNIRLARYFQAFRDERRRKITENHLTARDFILEQVLPVPANPPSLDSLLHFKMEYGDLLPALREKIEAYSNEIALIQNDEERRARMDTVSLELKEDIEDITDAMKFSWNKIVFEVITPLAGAGGAVYATNPAQNAVAAGAAGFAFIAACYQAISTINVEKFESRPLAYLAFANHEFQ